MRARLIQSVLSRIGFYRLSDWLPESTYPDNDWLFESDRRPNEVYIDADLRGFGGVLLPDTGDAELAFGYRVRGEFVLV